jgi:hypothetical protein
MTEQSLELSDSLDTEKLSNGKHVWVWTSPGGKAMQGPKQYSRARDALAAGRKWLEQELAKNRPQPPQPR